jgi:hypothetical protein
MLKSISGTMDAQRAGNMMSGSTIHLSINDVN